VVVLRCRAEGVRGSSLAPDDGTTLKRSSVEMGSLWDLMTPNTIFRASKVACFGHASRRWAVISTSGKRVSWLVKVTFRVPTKSRGKLA
jgi:hypothetical protein